MFTNPLYDIHDQSGQRLKLTCVQHLSAGLWIDFRNRESRYSCYFEGTFRRLERLSTSASGDAPDSHEIILAVTELRDAETNIRQVLRALPDDDASNSPVSA
jgi:hypothetical protein